MVESSAPVGAVWTAVRGVVARAGEVLSSAASPVAPPALVRASLVEAVWLAARVWLYPWGFTREHVRTTGSYASYRTDGLPLAQRGLIVSDVRTAGTPILLVHGLGDNRSVFAVLARALRRRGYGVVHAVNINVLTVLTGDVRSAAAELGRHVDRLRERTGSDSVHIIGHSLGGLIARYFVQRLDGDTAVDTLITLGSPHRGSMLAHLLPGTALVRQLRPGSDSARRARRARAGLPDPVPGRVEPPRPGHRAPRRSPHHPSRSGCRAPRARSRRAPVDGHRSPHHPRGHGPARAARPHQRGPGRGAGHTTRPGLTAGAYDLGRVSPSS